MTIGDRVRLLHSNEEGIISKIVSKSLVEVEIEEGFHIPVKLSELVLVSKEEQIQFGGSSNFVELDPHKKEEKKPNVVAQHGIFTAFTAINDQRYAVHLINNTDFDLPFVMGRESNQHYEAIFNGRLSRKDHLKIYEVNIQNFDQWGVFIFQFLFFREGINSFREPMLQRIRYRASTFFKSQQKAPLLDREAYVIQLDKEDKTLATKAEFVETPTKNTPTLDPQKIKEQMLSPKETSAKTPSIPVKPPKLEVDLHIEKLTQDFDKLNSAEIIQLQIQTFESNLESAIATGMHEIIFIHGVGNGKLRNEIHRRLSGNPAIKYFQDARKEKFGYGATTVRFN